MNDEYQSRCKKESLWVYCTDGDYKPQDFFKCTLVVGWNDEDQYLSNFESPEFYNTFYYLEYQLIKKNFSTNYLHLDSKVFINYKIESMSL